MTDKTKRKVNPRRRLLIRLIFGIGVLVAVIASGVYLLRPKGAQIAFVAPDENGVDNIWIADLNNPENPRQLTFFQEHISFRGMRYLPERNFVIYGTGGMWEFEEIHLYDIRSGVDQKILTCEASCPRYTIHPDGNLIAYQETSPTDDIYVRRTQLFLYDVQTSDELLIYETLDSYVNYWNEVSPRWIGDTDLLVFRLGDIENDGQFGFYSLEEQRIIERVQLNAPSGTPFFNSDGSRYIYHAIPLFVEGGRILEVRDTSNLESPIFSIEQDYLYLYYHDWHPDNERVIIESGSHEDGIFSIYISLYDTTTGNRQLLMVRQNEQVVSATFNHDGSQILFTLAQRPNNNPGLYSTLLFDLETGAETLLPFNSIPWWVNGGR